MRRDLPTGDVTFLFGEEIEEPALAEAREQGRALAFDEAVALALGSLG